MELLPSTLTVDADMTNAEVRRMLGEATYYQPPESPKITTWGSPHWKVERRGPFFRIVPRTRPTAVTWLALVLATGLTFTVCAFIFNDDPTSPLALAAGLFVLLSLTAAWIAVWRSSGPRGHDPPLVEFSKSTGEVRLRGLDSPIPGGSMIRLELVRVRYHRPSAEALLVVPLVACVRQSPTHVDWLVISDGWSRGNGPAARALSRALNIPLQSTDPSVATFVPPPPLSFRCETCGYDLRGIPRHTCPECGSSTSPEYAQPRDSSPGASPSNRPPP